MIHKIECIVSIGKFRDFQAVGDIAFQKLTLIYADNGIGKTTLTAILRSLSDNNPNIIQKRITTNHSAPQAVQIIERDAANTNIFHTYRPTGWSNPLYPLEIFDVHFVTDNIYSGVQINSEHGYNLHQFVIGASGVAIRQQIEQNKTDKTAAREEIERVRNLLFGQVGFGLNPEEIGTFLSLNINDTTNIVEKIMAAQIQLSNAQSSLIIQTFQALSMIPEITISIDIQTIITDLQMTFQQIQDAALQQLFQTHCQDLSDNGVMTPENWLRTGFNYVRTKNQSTPATLECPFCKQSIGTRLDIIRSYSQTFNDALNALVARLEAHRTTLQSFSVLAAMQPLQHLSNQNTIFISNWQQYLPTTASPLFNFLPAQLDFQNAVNDLLNAISQKISNPSVAVAIDSATNLLVGIQTINTGVANYNQTVRDYNSAIATFRTTIPTIPNALVELNRLNRIRLRFESPIDVLCVRLNEVVTNLKVLDNAYPRLVAAQETAASAFFSQYGTSVNNYLGTIFQTPFQITNIQNVRPAGRATQSRFGYSITVNGQPVSFDNSQTNSTSDCLSEGDKSTLALSFFMAKLDNDPNKADKVVVLDDPLSSLDSNRRLKTIKELIRLAGQVRQLIILSHDGKFLYDINRRVGAITKKGLKLSYINATDTTVIENFDIEKSLQNAYFMSLDVIRNFISNGTDQEKASVRGEIRIALEYYIIFKFYNALGANVQGTFGKLITRLEQAVASGQLNFRDPNSQQVIADLRELNEISWDAHHGDSDVFETITPIPIEQISLLELKNYFGTTLNLIDNRL